MIQLQSKIRYFCCAAIIAVTGLFFAFHYLAHNGAVFADDETIGEESHFVTIYDENSHFTVKTAAMSVKDVLERAGVTIAETDIVEPSLDTMVSGKEYKINIYRSRPALVIDGNQRHYLMTASYDPKTIATEAGLVVYDGDEITPEVNQNFLEAGAVSVFRIQRNGGRTLTIEETLPYPTETHYDYSLAKGETRLEQAGEDGRKVSVYEIQFQDNVEVARTLVSEEVKNEPVTEIVTVGAQVSVPPERAQCAGWAREAGVSEGDLAVALELIYHESGCRVDATNRSSGAYGIPQALPGSKMASQGADWETNPVTQIRWMIGYVTERYGGWQQAMNYWQCIGTCSSRMGTIQKNAYWY